MPAIKLHKYQTIAWNSKKRFIAFIAGVGGGKCGRFTIPLSTGELRFVEDIQIGDELLSLDTNLKIKKTKVKAKQFTGKQEVFEVKTLYGRKTVVTGKHPFFSSKLIWEPLRNLDVGSNIAVPRIIPIEGNQNVSKSKVKLLAYLIAEGCTTTGNAAFSTGNKEILSDIKKSLPLLHKISKRGKYDYVIVGYREKKGFHPGIGKCLANGCVNIVREWIKEWGLDGKRSYEKTLPDDVFKWNNECISLLLNRLYACDGYVRIKRGGLISYTTTSEKLAYQMCHLLLRFGVVARIKQKTCSYKDSTPRIAYNLEIRDYENQVKFEGKIGIFTSYKSKRLKEIVTRKIHSDERMPFGYLLPSISDLKVEKIIGKVGMPWKYADKEQYTLIRNRRKNGNNVSRSQLLRFAKVFNDDLLLALATSDIKWDKITSIKSLGVKPTWDIEVEGTHNFVGDDVFLHNTFFGPVWLSREIVTYPGKQWLVVAPYYKILIKTTIPSLLTCFSGTTLQGDYKESKGYYSLPDGGKIWFGSTDKPETLEGGQYQGAWLDEAGNMKPFAWTVVQGRLGYFQGRALLTTTPYCYSSDTEIYTKSGWKRFDELTYMDEVLACNKEGDGYFETPKEIIWQRYKGQMFHFKGPRIDLLVTPEHKIIYTNHKDIYVKTAKDFNKLKGSYPIPKTVIPKIPEQSIFTIPAVKKATYKQGKIEIDMKIWAPFFGWYLSEGCCNDINSKSVSIRGLYRVNISQNSGWKKDKIRRLLNQMPFNWMEFENGFCCNNKTLWEYLRKFGKSCEKFIPSEMKFIGVSNLRLLINAMVLGDGSYRYDREREFIYYTTSPQLAEDFQEICLLIGISTKKKKHIQKDIFIVRNRVILAKNCYPIYHISERKRHAGMVKTKKTVSYDGFVGCVTTSTGFVLVRRNGEECVCGNSLNWLFRDFYKRWVRGDKDYDVITFRSIDSPYYPREEYERAKATLPSDVFAMRYDGQFTRRSNLCFANFDHSRNVVAPFEIPEENVINRFGGIDFGFTHPTVFIEFTEVKEEGDPIYYVTGEYYQSRRLMSEHAEHLTKDRIYYADPSGPQSIEELCDLGYDVTDGNREVDAGIEYVDGLFKTGRLRIFNTCSNLLDELELYRRDEKDNVVKEDDHAVDGLRYGMMGYRSSMLSPIII